MRISGALAMTISLTWGTDVGLGRSCAVQSPRPAITIRVVNESEADGKELARAKKEAVRIFAQAGVDLVWLDCELGWGGNPCQRERGPWEFWLRIVSHRPAATTRDVLGFAELDEGTGDGLAGVYYPALVATAKKWTVRLGDVMGAAVAHEVGHLVLGANVHSRRGVMQASWGKEQCEQIGISELNFTADQARMFQEQFERRAKIR
jgi:hypothetical protein